MTPLANRIIKAYYPEESTAFKYLYQHSLSVTRLAILIAEHNSKFKINMELLKNSAMLHDIGIFMTHAPGIGCYGSHEYIEHGYLGRDLLEKRGLHEIAPVCERHVGVGFNKQEILDKNLPIPYRDMMPVTMEEKIVCYADKFFSKQAAHLSTPKQIGKIRKKMFKYGPEKALLFNDLAELFGFTYIYD